MKVLTLLLVLTCAANAQAIGQNGAYYDGDDPNPAPLKYTDETLTASLALNMKNRNVTAVKNAAGAVDPGKLSRVEKIALMYLVTTKPGAELDVVVEDKGQFFAVETYWEGDTFTVKAGAPREKIYGQASAKEEISKKYGVGPFVDEDAKWDNDSLYVVETALSTLSKIELEGIAGLPFHRLKKDPSGKAVRGTAIAMYVPEKNRIELYDGGIDADKRKFFGTADKPMPLSVATVIHECGHAIARAGNRVLKQQLIALKAEYDAMQEKLLADRKKYNEDKATYARTKDAALGTALNERGKVLQQLSKDAAEKAKTFQALSAKMVGEDKGSALEKALEAKLPVKSSPTVYGRTSPAESFAECLAIYKLDRAALERAAPGVPAWFESAEYAALAKGATVRP